MTIRKLDRSAAPTAPKEFCKASTNEVGHRADAPEAPSKAQQRITGANQANASNLDANIGGRGPASASFVGVRAGPSPMQAVLNLQVELQETSEELSACRSDLKKVMTEIDRGLVEARRERDQLRSLERRLTAARKKHTALGGAATVVGFLLGGPLGGIAGNAAGFATLAEHDRLSKQVEAQRRKLTGVEGRLKTLEGTKRTVQTERRGLEGRASALQDRQSKLVRRGLGLTDSGGPAEVAELSRARHDMKTWLADARSLLEDYATLTARAKSLGRDVEGLRAELIAEIARVEPLVEAVERALETAVFDLTFSVIGASHGLGLLKPAEAKLLKNALSALRLIDEPTPKRVRRLATTVAKAVLPTDRGLAEKIAVSVVGALAADIADDQQVDLRAAALAALGPAQAHLADTLLDPEAQALKPVLAALINMPNDRMAAAAQIYGALAAVVSVDETRS